MEIPKNYRPLKWGNSKLSKNILTFNLPPIESCLNCGSCSKTCYAKRPYARYQSVRKSWQLNYDLARYDISTLHDAIIKQLSRVKKHIEAVRIHTSGDFFSPSYVRMWVGVAEAFPHISFYGYSKVVAYTVNSKPIHRRVSDELVSLRELPNVRIHNSLPAGDRNYDTPNGIKDLAVALESYGLKTFICPATQKGHNEGICGVSCNHCWTSDVQPLFIKH